MGSPDETSKTELLARIKKGDQDAENELVEKYYKGLFYILKRRCDDPQTAADMAQDAFIVVLSKARSGEIRNPEALAGFIRQTGLNVAIGHYRKENRRATDTTGEVQFDISDTRSDVSKALESKQTSSLVSQVIDELKQDRDKDILRSFYVEEQDKSDICGRLELTPAHFDRVLFRARGRLKQLIEFKLGGQNAFH